MQETILFRDLAVVLLAATLSGWILQRLGFSAVVGYLPESTPELGKTLAELNLSVRFGIQICGIERGGVRLPNSASTERLQPADRLLLLGTHPNIRVFNPISSATRPEPRPSENHHEQVDP